MLSEEPDLTAELDEAEDIVMGRVDKVEIHWGVRYGEDGSEWDAGPDNERRARHEVACWPETAALVRRTVTYGPWEAAPDETPEEP